MCGSPRDASGPRHIDQYIHYFGGGRRPEVAADLGGQSRLDAVWTGGVPEAPALARLTSGARLDDLGRAPGDAAQPIDLMADPCGESWLDRAVAARVQGGSPPAWRPRGEAPPDDRSALPPASVSLRIAGSDAAWRLVRALAAIRLA